MDMHTKYVGARKVDITVENGEVEETTDSLVFFDADGRVALMIPERHATGLKGMRSGDTLILTIRMDDI